MAGSRHTAFLVDRLPSGEAAGGVLLILAAVCALVVANLAATADGYVWLLHRPIGPVLSPDLGPMTIHLWINDGLMALFFLIVGLEIKREMVVGSLASAAGQRLPIIAAAAGMAVPALVFLGIVHGAPGLARGWAIPAATDIAFAVGVMALLGRRVPMPLKLLLTTIAVADDMGAVAIIAVAYTASIHGASLAMAGVVAAVMFALNRRGVRAVWPYLVGFACLWMFVLASGVHATIAGVVTALLIPSALIHRLEAVLQPISAYLVVPLFAFANAGVVLTGISFATLAEPLVLGIAAGLFLGKQLGIFGAIWCADRIGIARRPAGVSWRQIHGMALLAGIGFTMSLFIGGLAFADPMLVDRVRLGVLTGSLLSAVAGAAILWIAGGRR